MFPSEPAVMRHSSLSLLTAVLLLLPSLSGAQTVASGRDVCSLAWFHNQTAGAEFRTLSDALERTERHRHVVRIGAAAAAGLVRRVSAIRTVDLVSQRAAADRVVSAVVRSQDLAGVQASLSSYCLDRLKRLPASFTAAQSTLNARLEAQAALPEGRLIAAFSADSEQLLRDFGTPEAAARTIRAVLRGVAPGF